jgi:hypothetical protein
LRVFIYIYIVVLSSHHHEKPPCASLQHFPLPFLAPPVLWKGKNPRFLFIIMNPKITVYK